MKMPVKSRNEGSKCVSMTMPFKSRNEGANCVSMTMPVKSRNEGSKYVSMTMTWRAICACHYLQDAARLGNVVGRCRLNR